MNKTNDTYIEGVFCGTQITRDLYAEAVGNDRFVIRDIDATSLPRRLGEVMGGQGIFLALTMKGDPIGIESSLIKAATKLRDHRAAQSRPTPLAPSSGTRRA